MDIVWNLVDDSANSPHLLAFHCYCHLRESVTLQLMQHYKTSIFLNNFFLDISSKDVAYNLTFKTGDMPYAGTDANVTLQLFGDKGQTEKIMLRQESGKTLKRFDRGRTDRFTVQTMDVGKVSKMCNYF